MNALFPSADKREVSVLVPYIREGGVVKFFVQKRGEGIPFPNSYGLFGGGFEEGEDAEEALKREIKEELDIDIEGYTYITRFEFLHHASNVFMLETTSDFSERVRVLEGEGGVWMTPEEAESEPSLLSGARFILHAVAELLSKEK